MPRIVTIAVAAAISTLFLFFAFQSESWRSIPQLVGLGDSYGRGQPQSDNGDRVRIGRPNEPDPHAWRQGYGKSDFKEPKVESKSPYAVGEMKPPGSNYTRCLVVPKIEGEDVSWINEKLGDMIDSGLLTTAIYGMDGSEAPLHPIKNKGNEVMAYLSYIIDNYNNLPDIAIFMHSHRFAEHNNMILKRDASLMLRHLSPERVTREGYMNLRCHWETGCPDWIHPGTIEEDPLKPEEHFIAKSWVELFPDNQIPTVLAQPCCGQFAVSRARIEAVPHETFVRLRDWVLNTEHSNYISGRIFEYLWQYIFSGSPVHCPSMSACYCDGFGICFGDAEKFDYYFELDYHRKKYQGELDLWEEKAKNAALGLNEDGVDVPEPGRDEWLRANIESVTATMDAKREDAIKLGRDPEQRAKEAGRVWENGDGF